jgi:hypothetical protein
MNKTHYILLASFLGSVGVQLGTSAHGWSDALTPAFVGMVLVQLGTLVAAAFSDRPGEKQG